VLAARPSVALGITSAHCLHTRRRRRRRRRRRLLRRVRWWIRPRRRMMRVRREGGCVYSWFSECRMLPAPIVAHCTAVAAPANLLLAAALSSAPRPAPPPRLCRGGGQEGGTGGSARGAAQGDGGAAGAQAHARQHRLCGPALQVSNHSALGWVSALACLALCACLLDGYAALP